MKTTANDLLVRIAASYSDDPGTSDLDSEQPVTVHLTLGEVRAARSILQSLGLAPTRDEWGVRRWKERQP